VDLATIQGYVEDYGILIYVVTFAWTFIEGETFVIFFGAAAAQGILDWKTLLLCAWFGSFSGDQLYFWIGRRWGPQLLDRFPKRKPAVEVALNLLRRYDTWFILSFRFIYGVRNVASFAMGTSGLGYLRFALLNFAAAFFWASSYVGIGYLGGKAFENQLGDIPLAFAVFFVTMFALVFLAQYVARRRARRSAPGSLPERAD
jgi:membrane protein DedA with SNARE-associated domain